MPAGPHTLGVTTPPAGDPFDVAGVLTVKLEPHEAVTGVDKTVTLPHDDRPVTVRLPPGVTDGMVLRVPGPAPAESADPTEPANLANPAASAAPREIYLRVSITSAPAAPDPLAPVAAEQTTTTFWAAPPPGSDLAAAPKRSNTRLFVGIGAAAAVVLLVVCGGAIALALKVGGARPSANAGLNGSPAVPVASPTPTAMTPSQYRVLLGEVDLAMAAAIQDVVAARTSTALSQATARLANAAETGHTRLSAAVAPVMVQAAHRELVRTFALFETLAFETAGAAESGAVCTGSAAVPKLTNSPVTADLRTAIQALAAVNTTDPYKVGGWLPPPAAEQTRQLANGTFVKKGTRNGSGQFKIDNKGGTTDVSVSLVPAGTKASAFTVYVRAGANVTVRGVKDATYEVYLAEGVDWDPATPGFTRECGFAKFDDTLKFSTSGGRYTIWTITLQPSSGGNAATGRVKPEDYPQ